MSNGKLPVLLVFILLATILPTQAQELSPAKAIQISQAEAPILYGADFAVAEDGVIFMTDSKDGNIKCYDPDGRLLAVIGRRGPGPEEFLGPSFCDYQASRLSVLDGFKIKVFERKARAALAKIGEIPCMACTSDVILSGKGVLVDAYIRTKEGKFSLTLRGLDGSVEYLLPNYLRYGFKSEGEHNTSYSDLSMLTSQRGFLSVLGDKVYFVFDARPIVTSLNLDGSRPSVFGGTSANYREPSVNQAIRNNFKSGSGDVIRRERNKVSCITGILADQGFVGVLFSNYDAEAELWRLYLQRYDPAGKLLSESLLREAVNYGSFFNYYYQRGSGVLYIMSERYGDEADDYRVLGYKIR